MNKLQKITHDLRRQLDKLESLIEKSAGKSGKNSRKRIGKARQHSVSATQRKRTKKG